MKRIHSFNPFHEWNELNEVHSGSEMNAMEWLRNEWNEVNDDEWTQADNKFTEIEFY